VNQVASLSIGEEISERRFSGDAPPVRIELYGKPLQVQVTPAALRRAAQSSVPVLVELELYFSCLVRKQIRFRELHPDQPQDAGCARIGSGLQLTFRAVTTRHCSIEGSGGQAPVETMPVKKPGLFVPAWVRIDYRSGQWRGSYGYTANPSLPTLTGDAS
jgi:hypothetical protein